MYVCMHACMHVCMYACIHACMYACIFMHVCMYARTHVCIHACMHACMRNVCTCVSVCLYVCCLSLSVSVCLCLSVLSLCFRVQACIGLLIIACSIFICLFLMRLNLVNLFHYIRGGTGVHYFETTPLEVAEIQTNNPLTGATNEELAAAEKTYTCTWSKTTSAFVRQSNVFRLSD